MGQKVNPIVMRLSVNKDWTSKWYAKGEEYSKLFHEDLKIRNYINENINHPVKNGSYYTCIPVYVGHGGESYEGAL